MGDGQGEGQVGMRRLYSPGQAYAGMRVKPKSLSGYALFSTFKYCRWGPCADTRLLPQRLGKNVEPLKIRYGGISSLMTFHYILKDFNRSNILDMSPRPLVGGVSVRRSKVRGARCRRT